MLVIGLTGGIASGKSTVATLFAQQGVPIIDADIIAHQITSPNTPTFKKIIRHFGQQVLLKDGSLDRSALRDIIFSDARAKKWLENTLHPIIREEIEQQMACVSGSYCIIIIPLLFEVGVYDFINRILVVDTQESKQIERVIMRDQSDKSRAIAILKTQVTRERRLKDAHDIILNDSQLADLVPQVKKLHEFYMRLTLHP